jgi:hypothetical protein
MTRKIVLFKAKSATKLNRTTVLRKKQLPKNCHP